MSAARSGVGLLSRLLGTQAPASTLLIRVAVSTVFVSEGLQKFIYPAALGVGRFAKIGIPAPEVTAPFVGMVEIVAGVLVLMGALSRAAALALVIDMCVAFVSTKIPILLGSGYFIFSAPAPGKIGWWSMLHEARTDLAMLFASTFLLVAGPGPLSLDGWLRRRLEGRGASAAR
jgi:putative oxidoreductase